MLYYNIQMNYFYDLPIEIQEIILKKADELLYSNWLNDFNNTDDKLNAKWRNMDNGLFYETRNGYLIYTHDHSKDSFYDVYKNDRLFDLISRIKNNKAKLKYFIDKSINNLEIPKHWMD